MTATNPKTICILLAAFNGAKYIQAQIESIQKQSVEDWILLVRDDGSTDETVTVVEKLAADDPRISVLDNSGQFARGAIRNFSQLMAAGLNTECNVFFLCDQDDIWDVQKLELQSRMFSQQGCETSPLIVHSDLEVVDDDLRQIHPSLIGHMALESEPRKPLNYILTRNYVTGCAAACNRRLLEGALPVSDKAIMHDWWLAAVAAGTGEIKYIDRPLVRYRQHDGNTIGARGFWHGLNPSNNWIKGWKAGNAEFLNTFDQVEALYKTAQDGQAWPAQQRNLLKSYLQLLDLPRRCRVREARKLQLRQGSLLLQFIFYLRLITINR